MYPVVKEAEPRGGKPYEMAPCSVTSMCALYKNTWGWYFLAETVGVPESAPPEAERTGRAYQTQPLRSPWLQLLWRLCELQPHLKVWASGSVAMLI